MLNARLPALAPYSLVLCSLLWACGSSISGTEPPLTETDSGDAVADENSAEEESPSENEEGPEDTGSNIEADEEEDEEAPSEDANPSAYSGDLEIILYTQFGADTCNGTADLDVDENLQVTGDGRCNFGILGSQTPVFVGDATQAGTAAGTVDLVAFGTDFQIEWSGNWTNTEITCDYAGSAVLDSIGSIDYEIRFSLEAEQESSTTNPSNSNYVDFSLSGPQTTSIDVGTFTSTDGCEMDYTLYSPNGLPNNTLVAFQHGFARSPDQLMDWGSHLASWELPTLIMSLCHSSPIDVNLDQNGADVVELVESLHQGPVIYMGHSNGAISSIVAASLDDDAVAVLGLDGVERIGGDHTDDAAALSIPVYGIFGEGGFCNTWNSGLSTYQAAADNALVRVTEADHCDFEAPTTNTCTIACGGSNALFDDGEIQDTILGLSTAFLSWQALGNADGQQWWSTTGDARVVLENSGALSGL